MEQRGGSDQRLAEKREHSPWPTSPFGFPIRKHVLRSITRQNLVQILASSIGSLVGFGEPPSGSTVTATASASARGCSTTAATDSSLGSKRPLGFGTSLSTIQIW